MSINGVKRSSIVEYGGEDIKQYLISLNVALNRDLIAQNVPIPHLSESSFRAKPIDHLIRTFNLALRFGVQHGYVNPSMRGYYASRIQKESQVLGTLLTQDLDSMDLLELEETALGIGIPRYDMRNERKAFVESPDVEGRRYQEFLEAAENNGLGRKIPAASLHNGIFNGRANYKK